MDILHSQCETRADLGRVENHGVGTVTVALSCVRSEQGCKKIPPVTTEHARRYGYLWYSYEGLNALLFPGQVGRGRELMLASEADEQGCSWYTPS